MNRTMDKRRIFSVDEMNRMGLEAVAGRERTTIAGEGAQEAYKQLRKEIDAMQRQGITPLPVQD